MFTTAPLATVIPPKTTLGLVVPFAVIFKFPELAATFPKLTVSVATKVVVPVFVILPILIFCALAFKIPPAIILPLAITEEFAASKVNVLPVPKSSVPPISTCALSDFKVKLFVFSTIKPFSGFGLIPPNHKPPATSIAPFVAVICVPLAIKELLASTFIEPTFASSETIAILAPPSTAIAPSTVSCWDESAPKTSSLPAPDAVTLPSIVIVSAANVALYVPLCIASTAPSIFKAPFVEVITKP